MQSSNFVEIAALAVGTDPMKLVECFTADLPFELWRALKNVATVRFTD